MRRVIDPDGPARPDHKFHRIAPRPSPLRLRPRAPSSEPSAPLPVSKRGHRRCRGLIPEARGSEGADESIDPAWIGKRVEYAVVYVNRKGRESAMSELARIDPVAGSRRRDHRRPKRETDSSL